MKLSRLTRSFRSPENFLIIQKGRLVAVAIISLSGVFLSGCVKTRTLSDGSRLRIDHVSGFTTPSVTIVSHQPAGTTNWSGPQIVSSPGVFGSAASGVAVVIPVHRDGNRNAVSVQNGTETRVNAVNQRINGNQQWGRRH